MRALEELLIPGWLCPLPLSPALLPGFDKVLPRLERGDAASVVAVGLALHTLLAGLAAVRLESTAPHRQPGVHRAGGGLHPHPLRRGAGPGQATADRAHE